MFFSLAAYQARLTRWLVGIAFGVYILSVIVTGDESLMDYFFMMMLILLFISVLSLTVARNGEYLVNANRTLQRDEEELLQVLKINKSRLRHTWLWRRKGMMLNLPRICWIFWVRLRRRMS